VSLSPAAMDTLERARSVYSPAGWCSPAPRPRQSSDARDDTGGRREAALWDRCTVHGFCSSFRDWASE